MNKEQKTWLLISTISCIIFMSILIMTIYDIRFKYGLYVLILAYLMTFVSLIMYCLTQWILTREIVSILVDKIKCSKMNKEQKIWFLTSAISGIILMSIVIMANYGIRFKYGLYIVILAFGISYTGLIMFSMTQQISTREIVSILAKKLRCL